MSSENKTPKHMSYIENVVDRIVHPGEALIISVGELGIIYSIIRTVAWCYGVTQGSSQEFPSEVGQVFTSSCVITASGNVIRNSRLRMQNKRE